MIACENRLASLVGSRFPPRHCSRVQHRQFRHCSAAASGPSNFSPLLDRYKLGRSTLTLFLGANRARSHQRQPPCRLFSSEKVAASTRQQRWGKVRLFAKAVKYARIPALILSVYGLGYQQGIIDYSRDMERKQDELLGTILAGVGCIDRAKVRSGTEGSWSNRGPAAFLNTERDRQFRRVCLVGEKITGVAKKYVDQELKRVMEDRMGRLPADIVKDEKRLYETLVRDEEFELWAKAKQRMEGRWKYLLIETDVANAFVSELLSKRIFVTTSMMDQFVANDSEMALVIGHEVSHLILGHVSESNTLSTILRTLEVLLLSLDPSEGILSLGVMSFLATVRTALVAANSRDNEIAADKLGIKLAAMACYDTRAASVVFDKMHRHKTESGEIEAEKSTGGSLLSFIDTHPPSDDRYDYLLRASEEENAERYEETHCGSIRQIFKDMLKVTKESTAEKEQMEGNEDSADGADSLAKI